MLNQESLKAVINSINQGKKYPALQLVNENPDVASIISKLIRPRDSSEFDLNKKDSYYNLNQGKIQAISDTVKSRIHDNKNILQLFPEIELAIQILISSILSPKDMVKTNIIFRNGGEILTSELSMKLTSIIEDEITTHYKLRKILPGILRQVLFTTGSYINVVLPEGMVDQIINGDAHVSTESIQEVLKDDKVVNLGILGNPGNAKPTLSLERFSLNRSLTNYQAAISAEDDKIGKLLSPIIEVIDNYQLLKMPKVLEAHNKTKLKNIISPRVATEGIKADKLNDTEFNSLLYKDSAKKYDEFLVIPSSLNVKRKSIGRPLVMNIPSEATIPVYIPGDETKHVGYFVLIDIDGNPITLENSQESVNGLSSLLNSSSSNQTLSSMLIQKARNAVHRNENETITIDHITKIYSNIIEKDLTERLRNGIYNSNLSISNNNEIYRIMLARSLADKYTRLLYVPAELTTYYAVRYHENGVGKSYLDDLKILTSLRAILLFSKIMAMVKSSINLTNVNMTLDPNDPDPQKTIEIATHEIIKMRQQYFPLGINSPGDLVDWIQRAGFEFTFENHPGLPQTKFDFTTKDIQHNIPDSDLDELLRKQTYMHFGLSPEVVDNGLNSEFATTVVANNILFSKRILQLQEILSTHMTDMVKKIVINDTVIRNKLIEAIEANKGLIEKTLSDEEKALYLNNKDAFIEKLSEQFIEDIELDLPKPDGTTVDNQIEAYDKYNDSLEKTLDAWVNSESISSSVVGNISEYIEPIKSIIKNHYLRQWMSENGFMPELNDIVTADEDGNPTLDMYAMNKSHVEGIVRSCVNLLKALKPTANASDRDIESLNEPEDMGGSDDTGGSDDFGDDGGFGGDEEASDDFGDEEGGDDFGDEEGVVE